MSFEKILIVEDDVVVRNLLQSIFLRHKLPVVTASTLAEATAHLERDQFDLMLLDLRLPDGDGFQVCEAIKSTRPALPVVMITSTFCTVQGRHDGLTAGADAYLVEPVPAERLVNVIRGFVEPATSPSPQTEAWVVTDHDGAVLEISGAAHRLLNLSARGALGRNLTAFFTQDRHRILGGLSHAMDGQLVQRDSVLRPRDRRPFPVRLEICRESPARASAVRIRWVIEPLRDSN
jgi:DNA-binding response OmpR family regulator